MKMKTKVFALAVLALLLSLALYSIAGAQGGLTKTLATNFTLLNFDANDATVTAQYLMPDGSAWAGFPASATNFTIPGNGGQKIFRQYDTNDTGTAASGQGSVVISSDRQLGAVVQILANYPGAPAGQAASNGAYSGFSGGAAEFSVPLVMRQLATADGTGTSQIIVQNTGTAQVTVDITFISGIDGSTTYTKSGVTIQPGASYYYDLSNETNLNAGFYGSATVKVNGTGEVAVVSNLFIGNDSMQTFNAFPSTSATTTWFAPLVTSRLANGLSTPVAVQNLSGTTMAANTITLDCTADAAYTGSTPTFQLKNTADVLNGAATFFNPVIDTNFPDEWFGSCKVTAPGNVVAFVQMRFVGSGNAAAYEAIPATGTDKTVQVPLIAKRLGNGFATALTVQNLSNVTATVTLTYVPSPDYVNAGGSANNIVLSNQEIPAGGSLINNHRVPGGANGVDAMPDGWYGTVTVTSDQPIHAFVQLTNIQGVAGDTFMAHNAFTTP